MGDCNFCHLEQIKRKAKKSGSKIVQIRRPKDNSLDVYVMPMSINPASLNDDQKKQYFVAWFMALGTFCEC